MNFIDIHGHYAWHIDDGISTKEEANLALDIAKKNSIIKIVATPHVVPGHHTKEDIQNIRQRIHELKYCANQKNIEVYEGCELFLNHDCIGAIHDQLFIPFENTQYILVEFDVRKELGESYEVEDYLYEIDVIGYTPIIAHVERYFKGELDTNRIEDIIDNGYVIQVNSSSLLGYHGKHIQKIAYQLINQGLVHVIASDTHRATGKRIPALQDVYNVLSKKYDYQTLKLLMFDNPLHILNNQKVEKIKVNKKSFFSKLKRR